MVIWDRRHGRRGSPAGQGIGREPGRDPADREPFAEPCGVFSKKHAASAREAGYAREISSHRFSHPHYKDREVHSWRVIGVGARLPRHAARASRRYGQQECPCHGQSHWRLRQGLGDVISKYDRAFQDRFYAFTEPCYEHFLVAGYPQLQADAIERAYRQGARGLKILKTLGLYLRENITSGKLVKIDDPRFDPMWDACG